MNKLYLDKKTRVLTFHLKENEEIVFANNSNADVWVTMEKLEMDKQKISLRDIVKMDVKERIKIAKIIAHSEIRC